MTPEINHILHSADLKERNPQKAMGAIKERIQSFCKAESDAMTECPFVVDRVIAASGHPLGRIVTLAHKADCDLIAMGSHGQGMPAEVEMGSASGRVLRRSDKPVPAVRPPKGKK